MNVYTEERMLPGCLESIETVVDRIVVVDGAYECFPYPPGIPYSTDATLDIARCYGAQIIECPQEAWVDQPKKRSAYLVGEAGDWYLHIDADERFVGRLPAPGDLDPTRTYKMRVVWSRQPMSIWAMRLFPHLPDMRYHGSHNALWSGDRLIGRTREAFPIESARFVHLRDQRSPERLKLKNLHAALQRNLERDFRRQWNI